MKAYILEDSRPVFNFCCNCCKLHLQSKEQQNFRVKVSAQQRSFSAN